MMHGNTKIKCTGKVCEIAAGFEYFDSDFAINVYKVPKIRLEYYT